MQMLVSTLNDFLKTTRGRRGYLTAEILQFNHRITEEIFEASEKRCLLEYLGMKISQQRTKPLEVLDGDRT